MLEWIRKEAVERPKVIGVLILLTGGIFVLSMGWPSANLLPLPQSSSRTRIREGSESLPVTFRE